MPTHRSTPPSRERLDKVRQAVVTPMAMLAAIELGIFTALGNGPMTAQALAGTLGVKPRRLSMLLHQLVVAEFLELEGERFANSPLAAHFLVETSPDYIGAIHELWREQFTAQLCTADSIRSDRPHAKIDFAGMTRAELGGFIKGLHGMTLASGRILAQQPAFQEAQSVVEVGCGSAGLSIALCEAHPHLNATATDLPPVVPIAQEMIGAAGLAGRIAVRPADAVAAPLAGSFDIAAARSLFQVLSAEQCKKAARNIAAAIRPGGSLFIIGHILDDSRLSPESSVGLNVVFLNVFDDGEAYTESQYFAWLADAGFVGLARQPILAGTSLITARMG